MTAHNRAPIPAAFPLCQKQAADAETVWAICRNPGIQGGVLKTRPTTKNSTGSVGGAPKLMGADEDQLMGDGSNGSIPRLSKAGPLPGFDALYDNMM